MLNIICLATYSRKRSAGAKERDATIIAKYEKSMKRPNEPKQKPKYKTKQRETLESIIAPKNDSSSNESHAFAQPSMGVYAPVLCKFNAIIICYQMNVQVRVMGESAMAKCLRISF